MDLKSLISKQSTRGMSASTVEDQQYKKIESVVSECRKYVSDSANEYRDLPALKKRDAIHDLISKFVMRINYLVEGFVDDSQRLDTNKLLDRLIDDITNYGLLTQAMLDTDVNEIQCNGREIIIERKGHMEPLRDKDGNILRFDTKEQQDVVIRKLLGDVRLTPKDPLANARTIEGFRIAAVHSCAMSPDPLDPTGVVYDGFVLRKFQQSKMSLSEVVHFGTLSDNMARLLSLAPKGGLTWFTVGPTASGKTTLNNAILQETSPSTRTVLIQNPSEIDLRFRDASGRIYNNVLHLEAKEKENPTPNDATMQNLMAHTLRLSPTLVCFGELRTNPEFKLGLQIAQAGHPMNCTFHAESSDGAVRRFLTAYLAESGNEPSDLALLTLTGLVQLIVVQRKMPDGTRKILQISEVLGVDENNPNKPKINDLYIFEIDGDSESDASGNITKINGRHKRVGCLSDQTIRKLRLEGVNSSQFDFITKPVSDTEVETYTGENISNYGTKKGA